MRPLRSFILAVLLLACFTGAAKKPDFAVRFFTEARRQDTERFSTPVTLKNPSRMTYIEKSPTISERQVLGIYPFQAPDGSSGCLFKLDADGRIALESLTTQRRGSSLVVFVGTKGGVHQVIDMLIDKPVLDGIITIQSGLTAKEIEVMKKQFKQLKPGGPAATPSDR
jgi:hypothetical protein